MGLNGPQIKKLSLSTPSPINHMSRVYEALDENGLERLYMSRRIERRRRGPHNRHIIDVFMRVFGHALGHGFTVSDVMRDECPVEGARFRTDVGMRINHRQFFFEIQISKLEYTRWRAKVKNYYRLHLSGSKPFQACFLVSRDIDVHAVREAVRDALGERTRLNRFLVMTLDDFFATWDVVGKKCWLGAWDRHERFSLM